jgi:pimeloyl-ACP methyl ester carboxylesterase
MRSSVWRGLRDRHRAHFVVVESACLVAVARAPDHSSHAPAVDSLQRVVRWTGATQVMNFASEPSYFRSGRWFPLPPMCLEARATAEYAALINDPVFAGAGVAPGDDRPVLLIPGFLAGDWSLRTLHDWLGRMGYRPTWSGIAFNVRSSEVQVALLAQRLRNLTALAGRRVILVGQSRGGLLAKVLADRHPDLADRVIGLGSPLADPYDVHPVTLAAVRAAFTVNRYDPLAWFASESGFLSDLAALPQVPVTSIYSRTDGVVNWRACIRPDMDCIEARGSHVGLAVNPSVYRLLGDLLGVHPRAA